MCSRCPATTARQRRCRRHVPRPTPRCPAHRQPAAPNPALPSEPRGCRCHSCRERAAVPGGGGEGGRAFGERISHRELCRAGAEHAPSSRGTTKLCLHPADPGVPRSRPNLLAVGQTAASFGFPLRGGGSRYLRGLSCAASDQEPRKSSLCSSELSVA